MTSHQDPDIEILTVDDNTDVSKTTKEDIMVPDIEILTLDDNPDVSKTTKEESMVPEEIIIDGNSHEDNNATEEITIDDDENSKPTAEIVIDKEVYPAENEISNVQSIKASVDISSESNDEIKAPVELNINDDASKAQEEIFINDSEATKTPEEICFVGNIPSKAPTEMSTSKKDVSKPAEEIILDSDEPPKAPSTETKRRKRRTLRKSTGVGGKAPHLAIAFKPVRKSLPLQQERRGRSKVVPEYFEVEDDEEEKVEDDDDDIQVIENDPLNEVEVVEEQEGYCDVCGEHMEDGVKMVSHLQTLHNLVTCRSWSCSYYCYSY